MLLTKGKGRGGAASSVDELKKQASAAAVAKAVEVIKAGGTQAEAAAAAKGVAREILARGQQQINQKPPMQTKKAGKKGLMGKLRKNKKNKAASAKSPPKRMTTSAHLSSTDRILRSGTMSPDPESYTTGSMTGSRSDSSGDAASSFSSSSGRVSEDDSSKANSKSSSKASKESSTSSKPSLYLEESLGTNEDMSLITDTNASRSTIHVTDLLNMGNVMNAIDKALEEQDVRREISRGKKHWMDRLLDCEMCFAPEGDDYSLVSSNGQSNDGDGTIVSRDNPSVLSGSAGNNSAGKGSNALETVDEEKESSSDTAGAAAKAKDSSKDKNETKTAAEVQAKQSVSFVEDGSVRKSAASQGTDAFPSAASGVQSAGSRSPVTTSSKTSTKSKEEPKDDDSSIRSSPSPAPWKQLFGLNQSAPPNKQESPQVAQPTQPTQPMPKPVQQQQVQYQQVQQQQQAMEMRQDSNTDWRSKVTDEAPNPNPNRARNKPFVFDPKRNNPSVFIPPTAQPLQGEVINFGPGYGSPVSGQGYGYGGHPGGPQHYYPQHPATPSSYGSSHTGASYGPTQPFPPGTNNRSNMHPGSPMSMDASIHSRMDRYGGDEDEMINDAAEKSKSQLEDAASFVYRVLSGGNGDDATVNTTDQDDAQGRYQQDHQYSQYGGPPPVPYYPPAQQYQGQYSSPHQQQQYPPQQHYQQNYPPQQQPYPPQQHYPPQQQYQQNHPPRVDSNPNLASYSAASGYYDQNPPMNNQRFAA